MMKQHIEKLLFLVILVITFCQCDKDVPVIVVPPKVIDTTKVITTPASIFPDKEWRDNQNRVINAHGPGFVFENGFYYWFGEFKIGTSENSGFTSGGIQCYKSSDLINWDDMGKAMNIEYNDLTSDIIYGCRLERPKVVYNESTKKYVAYFKLFLKGQSLNLGYTGIATADKITGPYTYIKKFAAASPTAGSGDFALFKDSLGSLYHVCVRKSDRIMVMAKMTNDYLSPETNYTALPGIAVNSEAPAILLKNGAYHMFASGSNGWTPTAPRYYKSTNLGGPWTAQANPLSGTNPYGNFGPESTFGGQSSAFVQVQGGADNRYVAVFDVWRPTAPSTGTYIFLPFKLDANNRINLTWLNSWSMKWFD
jgi:hypothetical protein